jgi:hypothetical protein
LDSAFLVPLISAGAAGVFCILFVMGLIYPRSVVDDLKKERDFLRDRVEAERDRADAAVAAAQATRDVLSALQAGVTLGHQHHEDQRSTAMRHPPELQEQGPT